MISVSSARGETRFDSAKNVHFSPHPTRTLGELTDALTTKTWSPIIYKSNYRKGPNFAYSVYLVLDFDEGLTVEEFRQWADEKNYKCIVGASRNHGREKTLPSGTVKPACDRFRVVMPWERTIENRFEYLDAMRAVMQEPVLKYTDASGKDSARFFFPCREILFTRTTGTGFPVLKPQIKQSDLAQRSVAKNSIYRDYGVMGMREIRMLRRGYTERGSGNPTILRLARNLTLQGFSEERIREELINAGFDKASAWERAMERGIEYAFQAIAVAEENHTGGSEAKGHQADTDRQCSTGT